MVQALQDKRNKLAAQKKAKMYGILRKPADDEANSTFVGRIFEGNKYIKVQAIDEDRLPKVGSASLEVLRHSIDNQKQVKSGKEPLKAGASSSGNDSSKILSKGKNNVSGSSLALVH